MNFWLMGAEYDFVDDENRHEQLQDLGPHWPNDLPALSFASRQTLTFPFVAYVPTDRDQFH